MEEQEPMKRLYRSRTDRMFAGIFGGLGERFRVDPVLLRLSWILITIFTGFIPGIIAYIFAIFVIPEKPREKRADEPFMN